MWEGGDEQNGSLGMKWVVNGQVRATSSSLEPLIFRW